MQPLVRDAAARGASVSELTDILRGSFGHAYRRADMLEDLRHHRSAGVPSAMSDALNAAAATLDAMPRYFDPRRVIAGAGVAAFAISLLLPALMFGASREKGAVLIADVNEVRVVGVARGEFTLPNQVAMVRRTVVTPEPTPLPTPEPAPRPTPAPTPRPAVLTAGGPGALVTASWYGPGFYENRLPCWQWLQANSLPIQFLPDTWGVAHKTLPCGTMLVLTYGATTITVPVVDRGPYVAGREIDLSPRIRAALGCTDLCTVLMQLP